MANVLLNRLREAALQGSALANSTVGTIRLKLLKIGAWVRVSVRRVRAWPWPRDVRTSRNVLTLTLRSRR
jgi:hypothetical protein